LKSPRKVHVALEQFTLDFGTPLPEQRAPSRPPSPPRPPPEGRHPSDLLFFAIFPDSLAASRTRSAARRLSDSHGLTGALMRPERLHLTLHAVGRFDGVPDAVVTAAQRAAATVRSPGFELTFDRAMGFKRDGGRPYVLRCAEQAELFRLQRTLTEALEGEGLRAGRYRFTPHVTLAYDRLLVKEAPLEEPITWAVRHFTLVHSFQGQTRHDHLSRFALA
jgi:2'-5' RNA ligase